jgi:hypothetical protein
MQSQNPPKTDFDESDLAELDLVLEDVCAALRAGALDKERKSVLRRRLIMLVCSGINDPQVLRDHLIVSFERLDVRRLARKPPAREAKLRHPMECRHRAYKCSQLALNAASSIAREHYHELAKTWLTLAVQLEGNRAFPKRN